MKDKGNKNELKLLKSGTFSFVWVVVESDKNFVLIGDHSVCQNYNLSVFSTKPSFYQFLTEFLMSHECGTLLCLSTFFLFCLFNKDM